MTADNPTEIPPEILQRNRERITAFVRRARRVEGHSLLQDRRQFQTWAEGTTTIGPSDGQMWMTQEVPPEEAFESLACRCRPFILQGEPIYWANVFAALRSFLKQDPRFGPAIESQRSSWADAVAPKPGTGFVAMRPKEVESQAVWFATLADSWLYGDLVHADPAAQTSAAGHTLNTRYRAAVLLYGQIAIHVIATLNLIRRVFYRRLAVVPSHAATLGRAPDVRRSSRVSHPARGHSIRRGVNVQVPPRTPSTVPILLSAGWEFGVGGTRSPRPTGRRERPHTAYVDEPCPARGGHARASDVGTLGWVAGLLDVDRVRLVRGRAVDLAGGEVLGLEGPWAEWEVR